MKAVGIITRTKDRPIMLGRALTSVQHQTFDDVDWILVNDGGDPGPVERIAEAARAQRIRVFTIHNEAPVGRGEAGNVGLRQADTKYVVLHDDDDSWEPDFLRRTVEFLERQPPGGNLRGVMTRSTRVEEAIEGDHIVIKHKEPFNPWLEVFTIFQMADGFKAPPPISFLYRRDVCDAIGFYRADLDVLEDWEFNMRFLRRFEIGVIPECLANYHWRSTLTQGIYSNSCVGWLNLHAVTWARVKNELLRKDLDQGQLGMGYLINVIQELREIEHTSLVHHQPTIARLQATEAELRAADAKLERARTDIQVLKDSVSFRLGRALTRPIAFVLGRERM